MVPLFPVACVCVVAIVAPEDGDALPLVLGGAMNDDAALRSELALRLPDRAILSPEGTTALTAAG